MIDEHAIGERFRALAGEFDERPAIRKAEESGIPFLHFRDANRDLRVVALPLEGGAMVIGRGGSVDVVLDWDDRVSRIHARLEPVGGDWTIEDDGLSRNGTFVNGERVPGHRRLRDRDVVQIGRTALAFRCPQTGDDALTMGASGPGIGIELSPMQAKVLAALCRPAMASGRMEAPATNEAIAGEVFLSVDAVKGHLRLLFRKFEIEDLPQNQKRARLVRLSLDAGLVPRIDA